MLGLILGRRAGETRADPEPLMLPLFLLSRAPFEFGFLSFKRAPGVDALIGEPITNGLGIADGALADEGVLDAPSFGVFLAVARGVSSLIVLDEIEVSNCGREGRGPVSWVAAAGS